ncbi:MAG: glycoside hydrolase family 26 protein, partial [Acidimicrobiia bacterium]
MPNSTRSFRRACLVAAAAVLVATVPFPTNAQVAESTYVNTNQLVAGVYPPNQWSSTENIRQMSLASGKPLSLAGLWLNASESPDNVIHQLEQVWAAGATPFVNINVDWPPLRIIASFIDAEIANFGKGVGRWLAMGEGRAVLLAPMPEMNGDWVPYGMDPANFEEAYRHFVSLATQNGASGRVRWVFAPNGWSTPPHRMVDYYPGPEMVDLVGFSAYNWGTVSGTRWATVPETMCVALNEARGFAREKPFLITQTASATTGGDRSAWIGRMFEFLVDDPNAVGFLYFNIDKERDWAIGDDAVLPAGWRQGMQSPTTSYQFPLESWFAPGPLVVDTVAQMYPGCIADIERSQFQPDIEWLLASGITVGCAESRFCPTSPVTRQQMATFLVRALG